MIIWVSWRSFRLSLWKEIGSQAEDWYVSSSVCVDYNPFTIGKYSNKTAWRHKWQISQISNYPIFDRYMRCTCHQTYLFYFCYLLSLWMCNRLKDVSVLHQRSCEGILPANAFRLNCRLLWLSCHVWFNSSWLPFLGSWHYHMHIMLNSSPQPITSKMAHVQWE